MLKNILNLLILCGILCQGMSVTSAEADIGKQSEILVRHKRVYYLNVGSHVRVIEPPTPYIVNIKKNVDGHETNFCVGTILAAHVIITATQCASLHLHEYIILSGSQYLHNGTFHNVFKKKLHFNPPRPNTSYEARDGIALMFVRPLFTFSSSSGTALIPLRHNRPIRPHSNGLISGWGWPWVPRPSREGFRTIETISVWIMDNPSCERNWRDLIQISSKDICTYDVAKRCGHSDLGAPLVLDDQLVGIHTISGSLVRGDNPRPDVFAYLDHPDYFNWIRENINE